MQTNNIVSGAGVFKDIDESRLEKFKSNFSGPLLTRADEDYDEVRQLWNGMHDKKPALIVRCTGVADVIAAVNFARENNILISVRGGGHNVAGSASNDGGIMIDLSLMKGIRADSLNRTVHAQGGVTMAELDRETQVFGMVAPSGVVSTTGIAGLTLGGGIGWLRKKYGLSIDNLLSVDLVTAEGKALHASENQHADLFWAVRGGGGNFGIITSFEFRLHTVGPMVTLAAPFYPAEEAGKILPVWKKFMDASPDEVSSNASFWTIPPVPDFPSELHGRRVFIPVTVHCGPVEEGQKVLEPLRTISTPLVDLSGPIPWTALQEMFDPFFPKTVQRYYFKSTFLNELEDEDFDAVIPMACNPPQPMILIVLWHIGGAMSRIEDKATAFAGRKSKYLFSVDCIWNDPNADEEVVSYARNFLQKMKSFSTGGLYINFAGLGEEGEQLVKSAYGDSYERLVEIKRKYDPDNLFRMNQNIKP